MSDIDEKLREIFDELYETRESNRLVNMGLKQYTIKPNPTSKAITQIKLLFADEGYVQIPQVQLGGNFDGVTKITVNSKDLFMTGQEWYDRFVASLDDEFHFMTKPAHIDSSVYYDAPNVMKSAKRASGLSNE